MINFLGQKVRVYRNLRTGNFSVQAKVEGKWKVVGHESYLTLADVEFKVSEAGRQRVIRERSKNVHAFVVGTLIPFVNQNTNSEVSYNPYKSSQFFVKTTGEPITHSEFVILKNNKIYTP
jgi:hypothetical protein